MRTQVGIIGAGPAGLLLSHLLHAQGVEAVVLEARSRAHVERRVRAGVLEPGTVDTLERAGLGERLRREGLRHEGVRLSFSGRQHRLDLAALTGGESVTIYGQQEVVKDLITARLGAGGTVLFGAEGTRLHGLGDAPAVSYRQNGQTERLTCDFIAGCDGLHGVSRPVIPEGVLRVYARTYPFAWLGILAEAEPASRELVYGLHERGFALHSTRGPSVSRNYLQVAADEDLRTWPGARIWEELHVRLETDGFALTRGPILEKSVVPVRAFVAEPMRVGRLFLAGDAADGSQGLKPGCRRRIRTDPRPRQLLPDGRHGRARGLLRNVPEARLAGAGLLVMADYLTAPRRPGRLHIPAPARAARRARQERRRGSGLRRSLRGRVLTHGCGP